jgi:hypothetical protein
VHTHTLRLTYFVGLGGGSVAVASCELKSISVVEIDAFFNIIIHEEVR